MLLLTELQLRQLDGSIARVVIRQVSDDDWRLVLEKLDEESNTPICIGLQTARTGERVFKTLQTAVSVVQKNLSTRQILVMLRSPE